MMNLVMHMQHILQHRRVSPYLGSSTGAMASQLGYAMMVSGSNGQHGTLSLLLVL